MFFFFHFRPEVVCTSRLSLHSHLSGNTVKDILLALISNLNGVQRFDNPAAKMSEIILYLIQKGSKELL